MWRGIVDAMEARMETMRQEAYTERRGLLDRIQHPERVQVQPAAYEPVEAPRDAAELALVGEMVPPGMDVGHEPSADELAWIGTVAPVGARGAISDEAKRIESED